MKITKIEPLEDRVIIKPQNQDDKLASGLIIPANAKEKPQKGVVISSGPGLKDKPNTVKEGDIVLYGKETGTEINIDGEKLLIMRNLDIYGIIKEDEKNN